MNYSDPFGLCPSEKTGKPCTPGGVTWTKKTSNKALQAFASDLAGAIGRHVTVHSGDRNFVPKGGATRSQHLVGLDPIARGAIDFHIYNEDGSMVPDGEATRMILESGVDKQHKVRLIWHDKGTQTGGPHVHADQNQAAGNKYEAGKGYIPLEQKTLP